jgi:hypothetical protein
MTKTTKQIDPRSDLFCSCYTAVGAPTFNHKEASAIAAGFSEASARNRATALLRLPVIQQRINELKEANRERNNVTVDSVIENLTHDRDSARAKGDWSASIRADELLGKMLGCFTERTELVSPERRRVLDEREQAECRAIALIRLKMQISGVGEGGFHPALQAGNENGKNLQEEGVSPPEAGAFDSE